MRYKAPLILLSFLAFTAAAPCRAADDAAAPPPPVQSEKINSFNDVIQEVTTAPVTFSLQDDDIISWEDSKSGKYIYFKISGEKNEELSQITKDHLGEPMRINLNDNFILIPKITDVLSQQDGFVLQLPDDRRREFMFSMLDWDKQVKKKTAINLGAGAEQQTEKKEDKKDENKDGSVDGAAQGALKPDK